MGREPRSERALDLGTPKRRPLSAMPVSGHRGGVGTVPEEKFLKLQEDYMAIKKELVTRDEKQKQLLVRLAHAEEAAARAVRGNGEVFSSDSKRASEEIFGLRESVRELTRKWQQERERAAHFSKLAKDYKAKYDETMRLTRNPKKSNVEDLHRHLADAQRTITALQQQNAELRRGDAGQILAASRDEAARARSHSDKLEREIAYLRQQLLSATAHGMLRPPHALPAAELPERTPRAGGDGRDDSANHWILEEFQLEGAELLLDRATNRVYTSPTVAGEWPRPVGKLVGGEIALPKDTGDFFTALDGFLKTNQARLRDVFNHFDTDYSEKLDRHELGALLRTIMPEVSGEDVAYFMTMLDLNGDGELTYDELLNGVKECLVAGRSAHQADINAVLSRLKEYMRAEGLTVVQAFKQFDKDGRGNLNMANLAHMFRKLIPDLTDNDLRKLLAHLRSLDTDGDGHVSLWELRQALQMLRVVRVKPQTVISVAAPSSAPDVWVLEQFNYEGTDLLLDRATQRVYSPLVGGELPVAVGRIAGGRLRQPATAHSDFFTRLDTYLKTQQENLRTVFVKYDEDGSGALDQGELGKLLRTVMPDVAAAEVRFFMRVLDLGNADTAFTFEKLVEAIKEGWAASHAAKTAGDPVRDQVLLRVRRVGSRAIAAAFRELDTAGSGIVDIGNLALMAKRLLPGITPMEQRVLLAYVRTGDVEGTGMVSLADVLQHLGQVKIKVKPRRKKAVGEGSEWALETLRVDGHEYLLDRDTMRVYNAGATAGQPMRPVGRYVSGAVERPIAKADFFVELDKYLREHKQKLRSVFNMLDTDQSNTLDRNEQLELFHELMPYADAGDIEYLTTMLNAASLGGKLTYEEFVVAIQECLAANRASKDASDQEMSTLVHSLKEYVKENPATVKAAYDPTEQTGYLPHAQVVHLFQRLIPELLPRQMRFILAYLRSLDVNADGAMSYYELKQALGLVPFRLVQSASATPRKELSVPEEWFLEELKVDRHEFLLDRITMRVYPKAVSATGLMRPIGRFVGGTVDRPAAGTDFFDRLDTYLKQKRESLQQLFVKIDTDRSGKLERREVAALLQQLIPDIRASDLKYFLTMLDLDSASLTLDQLTLSLRECLAAHHALDSADQAEVSQVLSRLREASAVNKDKIFAAWREADLVGRGYLERAAIVNLYGKMFHMPSRDARYFLAYLHSTDVNGTGIMSLSDLWQTLGLCKLVIGKRAAAAGPSQPATKLAGDEWILEEYNMDGKNFLLDRRTNRLYTVPRPGAEYPVPVGRLGSTGLEKPRSSEDLFVSIDAHLRRSPPRALRAAFDTADTSKVGELTGAQLVGMLRSLYPQARGADVPYFVAMVDPLGKGKVTFQELASAMRNCVESGAVAWQRGSAPVKAVVSKIKTHVMDRHLTVLSLFREYDRESRGFLEIPDLLRLLRSAAPDLPPPELRLLLAHLRSVDIDADGRITFAELDRALLAAPYKRVPSAGQAALRVPAGMPSVRPALGAPTHPIRASHDFGGSILGGPPATYHPLPTFEGGEGHVSFAGTSEALSADVHAQLSEIPHLRAALDDARRQVEVMRNALAQEGGAPAGGAGYGGTSPRQPSWDEQAYRSRILDSDLSNENALVAKMQQELKAAWEKISMLQKRFDDAYATLGTIKGNHSRVLQQFEDQGRQLNQERKNNIRATNEERRLAMELEAARELEPMLEQARREKMALEKENHSLMAAAMAAPGGGTADMRKMRTALSEVQREKAAAERALAEMKRDLEAMGAPAGRSGTLEDYRTLRADRDALRAEIQRLDVELQSANDKLRVLGSMRAGGGSIGPSAARAQVARNAAAADDEGKDAGTLRRELGDAREQIVTLTEEVQKLQQLLRLHEEQVSDLRAAQEDTTGRFDRERGEMRRRVQGHERELDMRQDKIRRLEEQLARLGVAAAPDPKTPAAAAAAPLAADDTDGLMEGENIFELRLHGMSLERGPLGESPSTFLTVDFFEHETQATPLAQGLTPTLDLKYEFVVRMDAFFLQHMDLDDLRLELNKAAGMDFVTVGLALFPLRRVLEDVEAAAGRGGTPPTHYVDVYGAGEQVIGTVRLSAFMRKGISTDLKQYRKLPATRRGLDAAAEAAAVGTSTPSFTEVRVHVERCSGLRPRHGQMNTMAPYVSYQFPGHASHDTSTGLGPDPVFSDVKKFRLARTAPLEKRLAAAKMELSVFDDADADLSEAGLIGIATVPLAALAEGRPIAGSYPVYNNRGDPVGNVTVQLAWQNPLDPPTAATGTAAALSRALTSGAQPDAAVGSKVTLAGGADALSARGRPRYNAGESLDDAQYGRAALPPGIKDPQTHVTVGVGKLSLGPATAADTKLRHLLVMFDLGEDFAEADQRTSSMLKMGAALDFKFSRSFPAGRASGAQATLARLLRNDPMLCFLVVNETVNGEFKDIGTAQVDWRDVRDRGDIVDKEVSVLDASGNRIGSLVVTVVAQTVLRALP